MKLLILTSLISLGSISLAQTSTFVRIYDLHAKKIYKGVIHMVTDTSVQLVAKQTPIEISVRRIGFIKTKRSPGNNILLGSIIGASAWTVKR